MGDGKGLASRLRFPTLEVYAQRSGAALSTYGRPLTIKERKKARFVFEDSLDLEVVRVVRSKLAAAPTTLGNNIRTSATMDEGTLVHELTHVWQYQNKGTRYISDSLCHQVAATLSTGSRNGAYAVTVVAGKKFDSYTAEQQAVIVERWFRYPAFRNDAAYKALLAEVRAARPLPANVRRRLFLEEAAFGPGGARRRNLLPPTRGQGTPGVPLLRLEF